MACIWKHPESKFLFARYTGSKRGPKGNYLTVNRSTGTADKDEAKRIAEDWALAAKKERKAAEKSGDESAVGTADAVTKAVQRALQKRREQRLGHADLREIIDDAMRDVGLNPLEVVMSRGLCETWLASRGAKVKEASLRKYQQVVRDWLAFLGRDADRPLEAVTEDMAIRFRDKLRRDGLSAHTVNQTVSYVQGIYETAVVKGQLNRNPFAGVDTVTDDQEDAGRLPFTPGEVATLIAIAEGEWEGMIILAATSGLRLMDAARLKRVALDLKTGTLRTRAAKTGTKLILPLHPSFTRWLAGQSWDAGETLVFPTLGRKRPNGDSGVSAEFRRLMSSAGIDPGVSREAKGKKGRNTSQKSFHSLRHFAATQLALSGVRAEVARAITGHADAETHAGYITADMDAMRSAVNGITLAS